MVVNNKQMLLAVLVAVGLRGAAEAFTAQTSHHPFGHGLLVPRSAVPVHTTASYPSLRRNRNLLGQRLHAEPKKPFFFATEESEAPASSAAPPSSSSTVVAPAPGKAAQNQVIVDAESALANVGWMSLPEDGELSSDDPFVQEIDAGIQRDFGVKLDELLNPAKVVNLERDLVSLRLELAQSTGVAMEGLESAALTTELCDGGGGGEAASALRQKIAKKEADLSVERRSVFRGWLKNVFLVQAVISFAVSYVMATSPNVLFGQFDWYHSYNMDLSIKVLGYWWWWLFVVPSLRSRRPKGAEKQALDIAFLATPAISLVMPVVTKDTGTIWLANLAVVAASYAFAYLTPDSDANDETDGDDDKTPGWLKFAYKSLDFGSGRERGARK
jgi:hypothetical protein